MADCFNLSNAAELVEDLKLLYNLLSYYADENVPYTRYDLDCIKRSADAIEQLLAENAKLKAEREAAIADLKFQCVKEETPCAFCKGDDCEGCGLFSNWEWRGVDE